ncbi:Endonuclease 8-like 3, partial [Bienertia sinuspersici]
EKIRAHNLSMASQGSASSTSRSRSMGSMPVVKCYHDEVAPLRNMRHEGPTQGKRFFGCSHWPVCFCGFFKWADLIDNINELQLLLFEKDVEISSMEFEKDELKRNVKMLKESEAQFEEQVAELAIENIETLIAIKYAKMDKKFMIALVLSWVFLLLLI